ncbi:MAG: C25 family cysteine peptidase [Candidatus Thorarchaeota archaeon]|nr:C25 family cysteine peptidase [Candidatus Thorarchaeota archaeon]
MKPSIAMTTSILLVFVILSQTMMIAGYHNNDDLSRSTMGTPLISGIPAANQTPLQMVTVVASDPASYLDEFSYMAAVPSAVFYDGSTQYLSPLILSDGSQSEKWLLEDWAEYLGPDGGTKQLRIIGDVPSSRVADFRKTLGTSVFPYIPSKDPDEVAAMLAVSDWQSSDIAVFALSRLAITSPSSLTGSSSFSFQNDPMQIESKTVTVSSTNPVTLNFTPPAGTGWIEGSFDWPSSSLYFTHILTDPQGHIVDYSVRSQTYQERFSSYVSSPVPLKFWLPNTNAGEWKLTLFPEASVSSPVTVTGSLIYHPGHTETVVVPANAKSLSLNVSWDNSATDLNVALIDPTGRLGAWAPAGSIIANPGFESVHVPYPMEGTWTAIVSWMNATSEHNGVEMVWDVTTISPEVTPYLESAANGAVLASLLNAPLLYVTPDSIPEVTQWAIDHLGVTTSFLVDPASLHTSSLTSALDAFSFVNNLNNYKLVSQWIQALSKSHDVVVTVPHGNGDELFAPAAYSGAVHGAPVFSLCGDNNQLTSYAEATWAPYLIGPEIDIYVTSRYTTRTENGWYDERIPNRYTMQHTASSFETFLDDRGAYNATAPQSVVVLASVDEIKPSFDRSIQSHFAPGRIPAKTAALASTMVTRAALHRFLFRVADSADDALVSMYAYTEDAGFVDNNFDYYIVDQYENSTSMMEDAGFNVETHIGYQEVFSTIASQVALWTFSTHGSLTRYPTDPPDRPDGAGLFSLRDIDAPYGMETSTARDANGDHLVNPVLYEEESTHHRIESTENLEAAIGDIGSPIVIITACLLGGTRLPSMMMEHGAVAVMASPRTVYFQPAAMLSLLVMKSLTEGTDTGYALSHALSTISTDYTDPFPSGDPRDYANQHILYGDPGVHLYEPGSTPRVTALNPNTLSINGHVPSHGLPDVAALGSTDYLPTALEHNAISFDFYNAANFSEFVRFISLRRTVIIEPGTISSFSTLLAQNRDALSSFVTSGGTLVALGVTSSITWLPWSVTYNSTSTSQNVTILDPGHPLVSVPNVLSTGLSYSGMFTRFWANFTVLAESPSGDPVLIASTIGFGKVALTTINPSTSLRDSFIENVVSWSSQPSIILEKITLSEYVIWGGDHFTITLYLDDGRGHGLSGATLRVLINDTDVSTMIHEEGSGIYTIAISSDWTNQHQGIFCLEVYASKTGYDTLTAFLPKFVYIRPSPWLAIGVVGGVFALFVGLYVYRKRKLGEPLFELRRPKKPKPRRTSGFVSSSRPISKEEAERLRKEREKKERERDLKDYFGV